MNNKYYEVRISRDLISFKQRLEGLAKSCEDADGV